MTSKCKTCGCAREAHGRFVVLVSDGKEPCEKFSPEDEDVEILNGIKVMMEVEEDLE